MVEKFNCRFGNSGSYMSQSDTGNWVSLEDYVRLRRLLTACAENLSQYVADNQMEMSQLEKAVRELGEAVEET